MFWSSDLYKFIFKNQDKSLKEIQDRIECLQRSQVYVHDHITNLGNDISELKKLILHRHERSETYDVRRYEHFESYEVQISEVN